MTTTPQELPDASLALLADYARRAGGRDEMATPQGVVRPVWQPFMNHIAGLSPERMAARFARGNQYLRDGGVLYRQYDDTLSLEREWPMSHIPVILDQAEWDQISEGLIERADILEYVLRDFYGKNELVASEQLPATLLTQNPAWFRPMVGVNASNTNFLNFLSFEIGRGPDGKWWVISDLVEAPSTAGFVLENRMAMSRVFPNFFAHANIHRLAGFFQAFQQHLFDLKGRSEGEIALLTPGPMNQNYAEHAYIARYLGLLLVEGEDLIVQHGRAMVRTVAGLKPLSLLWNRVNSALSDPLELDPNSMLGTPGLLDALRRHNLKTLNAIGAGVLETRALMAFLPKIAKQRLGRDLLIPNIATWWCGHEKQRRHVLAQRERMMVGSAFSTTPLMADPSTVVLSSANASPETQRMIALLQNEGRNLVGQEAVTLSTTPVWENGTLVPRPMSIRIFLGRTRQGWQVMPGGYARVSAGSDAKALAMQRGGKVADVWVVSPTPVERTSLLSEANGLGRSKSKLALPSRAADNLFWLGRYVERAEMQIRLFRAHAARVSDGADLDAPLLEYLRAKLMDGVKPDAATMAARFAGPLRRGLHAAQRISDRFSPDGMMALRGLVDNLDALETKPVPLDDIPREASALLRQIAGFSGLVHENMYRTDGWRFLSLGLSLERAANMCQLLARLGAEDAPEGALDMALEVGDSVVTHRARYSIMATRASVLDLLGPDEANPRSVRYHISRARSHIAALPGQEEGHRLSDPARRALKIETLLATTPLEDLTPALLDQVKFDIWALSDALSAMHLV
jgi:uncharacterized circularly permuted ATP-grasp superfamily protein/uncharacterized alpha-E superfamily protein